MNWNEIEGEIKQCTKCTEKGFYEVKCPDDRIPTTKPQNVKLLFVSEAPPLNTRNYFFNENSNDRLRNSVLELLQGDFGYQISTLPDFIAEGFYLLPTVKCPTAKEGRNSAPAKSVIKLCAESHLKREIEYIMPDGVCLLGRTALQGFLILRDLWDVRAQNADEVGRTLLEVAGKVLEVKVLDKNIKFMISYWPTKRHRKFHEISKHIRMLMNEIAF
jgi:uracil-DNA glycosylase